MAAAAPIEYKELLFFANCDEEKELHQDTITVPMIVSPYQESGITTTSLTADLSVAQWSKSKTDDQHWIPMTTDKERSETKSNSPVFMRTDDEYVRVYKQHSGSAHAAGAPGTVPLAGFGMANGLRIVDQDFPERRDFLLKSPRRWPAIRLKLDKMADANNPRAIAARRHRQPNELTHEELDVYFEGERAAFSIKFLGSTTIAMSNPNNMAFPHHRNAKGFVTLCNTGMDRIEHGDFVRYITPVPGRTLILDEDSKRVISKFTVYKQGDLAKSAITDEFPMEVIKVQDHQTEPYHVRAETAADPGEQFFGELCPNGDIVRRYT